MKLIINSGRGTNFDDLVLPKIRWVQWIWLFSHSGLLVNIINTLFSWGKSCFKKSCSRGWGFWFGGLKTSSGKRIKTSLVTSVSWLNSRGVSGLKIVSFVVPNALINFSVDVRHEVIIIGFFILRISVQILFYSRLLSCWNYWALWVGLKRIPIFNVLVVC